MGITEEKEEDETNEIRRQIHTINLIVKRPTLN
jgi:predicted KAP-like P-loop ATPase